MDTKSRWVLTGTAAIAWLVVASYGFNETKADDWPYKLYMLALIIGAAFVVVAAVAATQTAPRRRLSNRDRVHRLQSPGANPERRARRSAPA